MRFSKRRALSQVIGALMMVAIVAAVGSVLMFQGIDAVTQFTLGMAKIIGFQAGAANENLLIEHVRMVPGNNNVELYITNIGNVEVLVSSIKMLKIDSQHLIIYQDSLAYQISIGERLLITETADLSKLPEGGPNDGIWRNSNYSNDQEYLISITTGIGSSFQKAVGAFNT